MMTEIKELKRQKLFQCYVESLGIILLGNIFPKRLKIGNPI